MSDIDVEIREAVNEMRPSVSVYLTPPLHAKVLNFAVEHDLGGASVLPSKVEGAALAVIAARYFRMVEDDRWATWLASQGAEEG